MAEGTRRRLAAIVAIDVAGYARLMGADEDGTLAALKGHREATTPIVRSHGGRVVGSAGDGLLLEFPSVTEAVLCAVEVQPMMADRNAGLPDDRKMLFRIGINLGDVMIDGDDIFGDGVNIAARLEGLAQPGGVCISQTVLETVRDRIDVPFDDMGEVAVKNIARPVRVWRWSPAGQAPGPANTTTGEAEGAAGPQKPSIAVLPFENLSGDPEQEYFSDGLTEDIITELSRWREFGVLARNATFAYKHKTISPVDLGSALNARYMLEGSVRRAGQRLRVTAQLIDTADGTHVWAERYDRDIADIFAVQDDITQAIASALGARIRSVNMERALRRPTASADAYDLHLKAAAHWSRLTREDTYEAIRLLELAVAKDPGYARAYSLQASSYRLLTEMNWTEERQAAVDKALEMARRGVAADDRDPEAQQALGIAEAASGNLERALATVQKAVELNPNRSLSYAQLASILTYMGRPEDALVEMERALAMTPHFPGWVIANYGSILSALGRHEEAEKVFADAVDSTPNFMVSRARLAATQVRLGKLAAAKSTIAELLRLRPDYTVAAIRDTWPGLRPADDSPFLEALRKAGMPE